MTSSIRTVAGRIHLVLQRAADHKVPQLLAIAMSLVGVGLGWCLLSVPGTFLATPSFRGTFQLMSPMVWGGFYIAVGLWMGVMGVLNRHRAQLPALLMSVLHCMFSLTTIGPFADGTGVPSGIVVYMGLSVTCLITQLACSATEDVHP